MDFNVISIFLKNNPIINNAAVRSKSFMGISDRLC